MIANFQSELKVFANYSRSFIVGVPYDMQLDKFYMQEWGFKGLKSDESPPDWISLVNKTDFSKGIQFNLSPTYENLGTKTTVFFILRDIREEAANVSEESYFEFTV